MDKFQQSLSGRVPFTEQGRFNIINRESAVGLGSQIAWRLRLIALEQSATVRNRIDILHTRASLVFLGVKRGAVYSGAQLECKFQRGAGAPPPTCFQRLCGMERDCRKVQIIIKSTNWSDLTSQLTVSTASLTIPVYPIKTFSRSLHVRIVLELVPKGVAT